MKLEHLHFAIGQNMHDTCRSGLLRWCAACIFLLISTLGVAQERVIVNVTMTQGTNMAGALSPDGSRFILAIQGVLWSVPAEGGEAVPLTAPEMDAYEPAWSPDGSQVTFYAFGGDTFSIWTMAPDGSQLTRVSEGIGDSRYPSFAPDGGAVVYSNDEQGGYSIWSQNLATGERSLLMDARQTGYESPTGPYFSASGNAIYPSISPQGDLLAFVVDGESHTLVVADLTDPGARRELYRAPLLGAPLWAPAGDALYAATGAEDAGQVVRVPLDGGPVETLAEARDVFLFRPSLAPDGRLFYTADGNLLSVQADGSPGEPVAFAASVSLDRTPYTRRRLDLADTTARPALGIIDPVLSPDGRQVAFAALGDLWLADTEGGQPRRLTDDVFIDISPNWSPDGSRLAFISDRGGKADIWQLSVSNGQLQRLSDTDRPANSPVWSPDGARIAFLTDFGNSVFISATVNVLDLRAGTDTVISEAIFGPSAPAWSPDGSQIAIYARQPMNNRFREGLNALMLLPAEGQGDGRFVSPVPGKTLGRRQFNRPAWSAQGEMVFRMDGALYLAPMSNDGEFGDIQLLAEAGENPSWSADGSHLVYLDGDRILLWQRQNQSARALAVQPTWQPYLPSSRVTVRAGAFYDGVADEFRESVDIVIEAGVITAVRPAGSATPVGELLDFSDGFVLPGLIEGHAHQSTSQGIALGELFLCHGITSVRETGVDPYFAVERREAVAAGRRPGPRVFTAGPLNEGARVSYGVSETVETFARAEEAARLSAALGLDLYKSYVRQDYAIQRYAIELAHAAGIPVTSHELYPAVANGVDQMEHFGATSRRGFSLKSSRFNVSYQDVLSLINASGMVVVPTLALSEGPGRDIGLGRDISAQKATLKAIIDGGGRIMAGTDSPFVPHAVSLHRELEIYAEAGLTPAQVLRTVTSWAGTAIGAGEQLGRIAPGYLGDLLVLGGNPFESMTNIRTVRAVIRNGEPVTGCPVGGAVVDARQTALFTEDFLHVH